MKKNMKMMTVRVEKQMTVMMLIFQGVVLILTETWALKVHQDLAT